MISRCCRYFTLVACFQATLFADDWPQWRGPNRDGHSAEKGLLQEWPAGGPKLVWQQKEIGGGYSTPSVVGDRLYLISNAGKAESVFALNVSDGKQAWAREIGKVGPNEGPQYPGSRGTPTFDAGTLYALSSDGDLACLAADGGEVRWKKNLRSDFGGEPGSWAYSESPLIDGEKLICTPGGKSATMVALNKQTGETIWKSEIRGGDEAGYASPIKISFSGGTQYVQFMQKGLVGVDGETGKMLWKYERTAQKSPANIPTPVADGKHVYSAAGRSGGGLVELIANGGGIEAKEVYFAQKLPSSIGGSVKVGPYLYGTSSAGFMCIEFLTGKVKWQTRGIGPGSILFADERLYLHGENGEALLAEAKSEGFSEKGRFTPADAPETGRVRAWAYPVVANGRLYLRDRTSLWSYDVKAK